MAYRKLTYNQRKLPLLSLIDLIFILLIFFVITSVMIRLSKQESQLYIPTPKNEPGEAQVLIQIVDADRFIWLDHTAIDTLRKYEGRFRNRADNTAKMRFLAEKMTLDKSRLDARLLNTLAVRKGRDLKEYFVLIRCPDSLPYHYAMDIIEKIKDHPLLEYGCVSGSFEDILDKSRILIQGNILQIDFPGQ